MSKTLLYSLAMLGDLVLAFFFYRSGSVMVAGILLFAALCFAFAAIGGALGRGGPRT